jgi:ArsR family transcriptional regulator
MPTTTRARKSEIPVLPFADRTLSSLTQVFRLLADESRLRMLLTLAREGEMHVSALCEMLGQSQPAVSHHLTLMRMAGLVAYRRDGKFNFYRLDSVQLGELLERVFGEAGRSASINLGEFSIIFSRNTGRRR